MGDFALSLLQYVAQFLSQHAVYLGAGNLIIHAIIKHVRSVYETQLFVLSRRQLRVDTWLLLPFTMEVAPGTEMSW